MIRLSVTITDLNLVLETYDRIKVYRAISEGGVYSEITDVDTRLVLEEEQTVYFYLDSDGDSTKWYKTSYFHSSTLAESSKSTTRQGGTETEKIGWSFGNYGVPSGEWGKILTADDMRYTYLWGIDASASDINETDFEDEQFDFFIRGAIGDFEKFLNLDIRKRIYKTRPDESSLTRSKVWREGVDYTDHEDEYTFRPDEWSDYGFVQLRHVPVISIERAILYSQIKSEVIDLKDRDWLRIDRHTGQIRLFPTAGLGYGPFAVGALPWRILGMRFPGGLEFDYTTGYETAEFVEDELREVIGKWACIKCLQSIGDGLLAGFSSQSVSLDGLSESFSSTQSATSIRGDTKVQGLGKIESLYESAFLWRGKVVPSMNRMTGKIEHKEVLSVVKHNTESKQCYEITMLSGKLIVITEDHSLFDAQRKEIKGVDIRERIELLCSDSLVIKRDVVKSVRPVKSKVMYDLSVADNENFLANGFIVHNSAFFGARLKSYQDEIKEWLKHNKQKYAPIPMGFVG